MSNKKPTREELIALLKTQGWKPANDAGAPEKHRTLEELVRAAHARHAKGETPGLISKIETALEIDLIQIQQLWEYLGLPM